jgi:hypothetical protein
MSERTGDTNFQEYHLVNNNGYGGQSYNIDADAAQSLGPVVVTQQMRENTADNVAAGLMGPHGQMLRQLKNEPQSTAQTEMPATGEVRGAVPDLNTPEGRAQNESTSVKVV